jgi:hypothetical protein
MQYIPEDRLPTEDLHAALADGSLLPWRVDSSGVRWFRCVGTLRGIAPAAEIVGDDFDEADFDDEDLLDDDCEFLGGGDE